MKHFLVGTRVKVQLVTCLALSSGFMLSTTGDQRHMLTNLPNTKKMVHFATAVHIP